MPIDWNAAIHYANLVKLAEDVAPTGDDAALAAQLNALNYTFVQTFFGNDLATDVNPRVGNAAVSFGFLALSPATGELVVSIRGTDTILEWIHDGEFLLVASPVPGSRGFTEDGFSALYKSLRTAQDIASQPLLSAIKAQIDSGAARSVTVCGHSLGGALTSFVALDVALNTACKDPLVYSFASPRPGDPTFAHHYFQCVPRTFRVANRNDLVPQLPPILPVPYEHVTTAFEIVPPFGQVDLSIACMHHLSTYLWMMGKIAGVNGYALTGACLPKPQ